MHKFTDRLQLIIDTENLSTRAFEQQIGCSNGVISRAILKNTDISRLVVSKIIETFPQFNSKWLLIGVGPIKSNQEQIDIVEEELPKYNKCKYCAEKERLIQNQNERINELREMISFLKESKGRESKQNSA